MLPVGVSKVVKRENVAKQRSEGLMHGLSTYDPRRDTRRTFICRRVVAHSSRTLAPARLPLAR